MTRPLEYQHIGLSGIATGTMKFDPSFMEWRAGGNSKKYDPEQLERVEWTLYGTKGHLFLNFKDGKMANLDGFGKSDYETLAQYFDSNYQTPIQEISAASDGGNFGDIDMDGNSLFLKSAKSGKRVFELKLNNVSQCVLPGNTKDEVEIQFHESDTVDKEEDMLVHVRLRFPTLPERGEDAEEEEQPDMTPAETFQKNIMERGMIRSVTGNVIAEFTQDQGTFVTPRGRYAIQMYSTFMRMHGAKYDYKISYQDVTCLYLLFRPDGVSAAIVISLEKPIRQGNQKYPHLVLQTNRVEHTMELNLTDEEIETKYDNQLQREMTMPMCSLIAKIFKILSQSKVYISNVYKSERGDQCVKCSYKTNDGLLFPLQKLLIFIHKPTLVLRYDDVESVEFLRYAINALSASKNFDLLFKLKASASQGGEKDILFSGIDRSEFALLHTFFSSKKLSIKADEGTPGESILDAIGQDVDEDEDESEDEEYQAKSSSSGSEDEEESSGGEEEAMAAVASPSKKEKSRPREKESSEAPPKKQRASSAEKPTKKPAAAPKEKSTGEGSSKKRKTETEAEEPEGKKGKKDKDPALPKGSRSAYTFFNEEYRAMLKAANPEKTFGELSKLSGEKWKTLTAAEKEKYDLLAQGDKDRLSREMAEYVPSAGYGSDGKALGGSSSAVAVRGKGSAAKKKKEKDPDAPKAALSAYNFFCSRIRTQIKEEMPDIANTDIMKEAAARWKALSAEDRTPYEQLAQEDKARRVTEMDAYKAKGKKSEGGSGGGAEAESGGEEEDHDAEEDDEN